MQRGLLGWGMMFLLSDAKARSCTTRWRHHCINYLPYAACLDEGVMTSLVCFIIFYSGPKGGNDLNGTWYCFVQAQKKRHMFYATKENVHDVSLMLSCYKLVPRARGFKSMGG